MNYRNSFKILFLSFWIPVYAFGYSVQDAIINAHENNKDIMSQLEKLRSSRLLKPSQFMQEFLPNVSVGAQYEEVNLQRYPAADLARQYPNSKNLRITQSLFNSGGSWARVRSVGSQIKADEANFIAASQQLALDTVNAYESVITLRVIHDLSVSNHKLAAQTLEYTRIRFKHGEVTRTDVLQAEARYAQSISEEENALAQVRAAEGTFERLTGIKTPEALDSVAVDNITLPPNLDELMEYSLANNPSRVAFKHVADQAEYDIWSKASQVLPSVTAQAQTTRSNTSKLSVNNTDGTTYLLNVNVPIIPQGGSGFVAIAQAKHGAKQAQASYQEVGNKVREQAVRVWSSYKGALAQLKAQKEVIKFNEDALKGVVEEEKIGTRTIIEVLNAQQSLYIAKTDYQNMEKSLIAAIYSMLNLMGEIDSINIESRE